MNIFVLDNKPDIAAQMHCDKHVVKMILETAQLLSTAHRVLDGTPVEYINESTGRKVKTMELHDERDLYLYKATHMNHPCAIWCREARANYVWLHELFLELNKEYTHRYNKIHACMRLEPLLCIIPENIPENHGNMTPFPKAMPDDVKVEDPIQSYRNYYIQYKKSFARWTNRETPSWIS